MSKVIMGLMDNDGFAVALIEPRGVSAWWKETAQTRLSCIRAFFFFVAKLPQPGKS